MRSVARLSDSERRNLFRETAQLMQVHEAIVEKDFWVCFVLDYFFRLSPWKDSMVFKGGTSLSKAYDAIDRFSEDIDLILDWKLLGYGNDEPWRLRSSTKQDAFGKEAILKTTNFLSKKLVPGMREQLIDTDHLEFSIEAEGDNVLIFYPRAFSLDAIQSSITLEIGPLAEPVPNEVKTIRSFAAKRFPAVFQNPATDVTTLSVIRTFWEKATILHQEAHRASDKPMPLRYSRHYYDLYKLSQMPVCEAALNELKLLSDVVQFKTKFYHCAWARFEDARPGSLKLLPPDYRQKELRRDYEAMLSMLFGTVPTFDEIMDGLARLESKINRLAEITETQA